jgi:hypothetical protein
MDEKQPTTDSYEGAAAPQDPEDASLADWGAVHATISTAYSWAANTLF